MNKSSHIYFFIFLCICSAFSGALVIYTTYHYVHTAQTESHSIQKANRDSLYQSIQSVEKTFRVFMKIGLQLAEQAGNAVGDPAGYAMFMNELKKTLDDNDNIYTVSASYAPYVFNQDIKLHAIQYTNDPSGEITYQALEGSYDYTVTQWYTAGVLEPAWVEPIYDASIDKTVFTYVAPMYMYNSKKETREFCGIFALDFTLDFLDDIVSSLPLHSTSYAILTTRNGLILAHPIDEVAQKNETLFDLARMPGNKAFINLANLIARTDQGETTFTIPGSLYTDYKAIFSSLTMADWIFIIVGPKKEGFVPTIEIRHLLIKMVLSILFFCIFLTLLACRAYTGNIISLWFSISIITILILLCIGTIWTFDAFSNENKLRHTTLIDSNIAMNRFFSVQKKIHPILYKQDIHFILTGIYIYSLSLETTTSIMSLYGYIWQKYNVKKDASIQNKEVSILNAIDQKFDKVYEYTKDNVTTIGWRFSTKIKGNFDYFRYPFDQQNLILMLTSKDYTADIILVPDFSAFTGLSSPTADIDQNINTVPWSIDSTYAFYDLTKFDLNFGIKNYNRQTDFPNLCYDISASRDFFYPFIRSILPVLVIVLAAFFLLVIISLSEKGNKLAATILSLTSGLLFAAILSHQTFQRVVESSRVMYLEYFYFIVYGTIILITINGILYALDKGGFLINYYNNVIARLLYWPCIVTIFFIITLIFFY